MKPNDIIVFDTYFNRKNMNDLKYLNILEHS